MKKTYIVLFSGLIVVILLFVFTPTNQPKINTINEKLTELTKKEVKKVNTNKDKKLKDIYLAGGCFWGLEEYFSKVNGVEDASVGYANGDSDTTSYERLNITGHAETVHVVYDANTVDLQSILLYYFRVVDPVSKNKQGNDFGKQYRTGIYYQVDEDMSVIEQSMKLESEKLGKPLAVEVEPLKNYIKAEEYHQDYLKKNPNGYCHIDVDQANIPVIDASKYPKPTDEELHKKLSKQQYDVTQKGVTEGAFQNQYWDDFNEGIYIDVATGEPLFSSKDKFESGCGWPSFTKPISPEVITTKEDSSFNMIRIEVRSRSGDSHLGHVFEDGPKERGGLRFCINSASIEFVKKEDMEAKGYGYLLSFV